MRLLSKVFKRRQDSALASTDAAKTQQKLDSSGFVLPVSKPLPHTPTATWLEDALSPTAGASFLQDLDHPPLSPTSTTSSSSDEVDYGKVLEDVQDEISISDDAIIFAPRTDGGSIQAVPLRLLDETSPLEEMAPSSLHPSSPSHCTILATHSAEEEQPQNPPQKRQLSPSLYVPSHILEQTFRLLPLPLQELTLTYLVHVLESLPIVDHSLTSDPEVVEWLQPPHAPLAEDQLCEVFFGKQLFCVAIVCRIPDDLFDDEQAKLLLVMANRSNRALVQSSGCTCSSLGSSFGEPSTFTRDSVDAPAHSLPDAWWRRLSGLTPVPQDPWSFASDPRPQQSDTPSTSLSRHSFSSSSSSLSASSSSGDNISIFTCQEDFFLAEEDDIFNPRPRRQPSAASTALTSIRLATPTSDSAVKKLPAPSRRPLKGKDSAERFMANVQRFEANMEMLGSLLDGISDLAEDDVVEDGEQFDDLS